MPLRGKRRTDARNVNTRSDLDRIRDIRSSERLFYQKITGIYATSIDYDRDDKLTQTFFKTVQNKMRWAAHAQTAAEVVYLG